MTPWNTILIAGLVFLGAGCVAAPSTEVLIDDAPVTAPSVVTTDEVEATWDWPIDCGTYGCRVSKQFGEEIHDRFNGFHTAIDLDLDPADLAMHDLDAATVPVYAIDDGVVKYIARRNGYGGVLVVDHGTVDEPLQTIYGHIDLASATVKQGDAVTRGQRLAYLGEHKSTETDGERLHLHFAMNRDPELRINGYVTYAENVSEWLNPWDQLRAHGLEWEEFGDDGTVNIWGRLQPEQQAPAFSNLDMAIPSDWDVEVVPSLPALNLFSVYGEGSARSRSQIFIRYFDANTFLTLSTVTIHSTEDLTVGAEAYAARRYDIEKRPEVADFPHQPAWRNERHIVTDFRRDDGQTRYYVVAQNPELDDAVYEEMLGSVLIAP